MNRTIVVGIDSTSSSDAALIWAAQAAVDRRMRLELVHATGFPTVVLDVLADDAVQEGALALLEKSAARVRESWPLEPSLRVDRATATRALGESSHGAALVVVGSHRLGPVERLYPGSLSYQIAAAASCPVVVVPRLPGPDATGVVVGADGSPDSLEAVRTAAAEADRGGDVLHVVHAWQEPAVYLSVDYIPAGFGRTLEDAERVILGETVAGLAETYPDLVVRQHLVEQQPVQAIVQMAADARLVVVGSRGRHGVKRALLGSVSHGVVLHATCPVMVTRTHARRVTHP